MAKVRCPNCKTYNEKNSTYHVGISYYCDLNCYKEKNNQLSKNKRNEKPNTTDFPSGVREIILEHDNYRCRLCKKTTNLVIHHIIYRSNKANKTFQNEVSNGITLCNWPCHLDIVHGNKKRFQKLCLGIVWMREVGRDRNTTIYELEKNVFFDKKKT